MKELIKPNVLSDDFELINVNCNEFTIFNCPSLECVCRNGTGHDVIEGDDEILF